MAGLQRPNYALRRKLIRAGVAAVVVAGLAAAVVTQRQRITNAWTTLQRHGVSGEWATVKRKAWDAWVAIRRDTPWPVVEEHRGAAAIGVNPSRSSNRDATATHGTHKHTQVAATSTKRRGKKARDDMSTPGSTP
jgi:hypothetical protein